LELWQGVRSSGISFAAAVLDCQAPGGQVCVLVVHVAFVQQHPHTAEYVQLHGAVRC
jgi:hypothetical protein